MIKPEEIHTTIEGKRAFKIHGGECAIVLTKDKTAISTLLGSCVAVMLYDETAGVVAMNHFLLPVSVKTEESMKFGLYSMEMMINEMIRQGCSKKELKAKIAGGANVVKEIEKKVGEHNIRFALKFCEENKISVVSQDIGGNSGRVVVIDSGFNTYVKYIERGHGIEEVEKADLQRQEESLQEKKRSEKVIFFD